MRSKGDLEMKSSRQQSWTWVLLIAALLIGPARLRAGDWPGPCHERSQACEPPCEKCVLVPSVRKESHVVYRCKELGICLPHRTLWDLFRGPAETCAQCGPGDGCHPCPVEACPPCACQARRKTVLLKKIVSVECPTFKCEVVCPPSCSTPCQPDIAPALPSTPTKW